MKLSLSNKLFLFICAMLIVIILPLFFVARSLLTDFGVYAYRVNEAQIRASSVSYLSNIAREKAKTYDQIFEKISTASSLMGRHLSLTYRQLDQGDSFNFAKKIALRQRPGSDLFYSVPKQQPIVVYWGDKTITPAVKKEVAALSTYMPTLIKAKEKIKESFATHVITQSGIGVYYTLDEAARKACYQLPESNVFDLRNGEPVTLFTLSKIRHHNTRWTRIYKDDVISGLMMTASTPIYDSKNKFRAITGIDLPVGTIIRDLINDTPQTWAGSQGSGILFSFLLDGDGKIIVFPEDFLELFKLNIDFKQFKNSSDIFDYSLHDSSEKAVREAAEQIMQSKKEIIRLEIDNEPYLMAVGNLETVKWHYIIVVKESDLTASLAMTKKALDRSLNRIWKDFMGHSVLIILVCILLVIAVIQIFIRPVRSFIDAMKRVANGDYGISVDFKREDEIGQMADAFNQMSKKLSDSEKMERQQARELEKRIKLRTFELEKSYEQLNQIKNSLEKTVADRTTQLRKLNEHLVNTEEMERKAIASDLHDSVNQSLAMSISRLKDVRESGDPAHDQKLAEAQQYLEQSVREIRSLIYQLSPPVLDDFDIEVALGFLIEETNIKHHAQITYANHVADAVNPDHALKVTIYRAVNELLMNIIKHAGTKKGAVRISYENQTYRIRVCDPGDGFDPGCIDERTTYGFGLKSLKERIQNFGGTMTIESLPRTGTNIVLTLPFGTNKK